MLAGQIGEKDMLRKIDIQMRDPFVLPLPAQGRYLLFGSTDKNIWSGPGTGFDCYTSRDLEQWEGPFPAFRPPPDFWSNTQFWAPECHLWQGRYYLFATFARDERQRGTQILVADRPEGPYRPHSDGPVTPRDWECLDGTLFVDDAGAPWMVFCHEWMQVVDGEMCAIPLADDLSAAAGEPVLLFRASEAAWAKPIEGFGRPNNYVTDGPFLRRLAGGQLLMLWSTIGYEGYAMGYAVSDSGHVFGPWRQSAEPLYGKDGGHGMLFEGFDGRLWMTLHHPNNTPNERPMWLEVVEGVDGIALASLS
jgi:arabinan endo-1,5-alpha-L-arabinosidase